MHKVENVYSIREDIADMNILDDESFDKLGDVDQNDDTITDNNLPDEYVLYNNNKLVCMYIRLSKLKIKIDSIRNKLYNMHKNNLIYNNKINIKCKDTKIVKLLLEANSYQ